MNPFPAHFTRSSSFSSFPPNNASDFPPSFPHARALCSIGLISGMLLLLPFLALALMASASDSPSSSSDQSNSCCRLPLEPLMPPPLKSSPVQNLVRKVSKERLLLRCCFSMTVSFMSSFPFISSTHSCSTVRNSRATSWTSGSICDTNLLNLQREILLKLELLGIDWSTLNIHIF